MSEMEGGAQNDANKARGCEHDGDDEPHGAGRRCR